MLSLHHLAGVPILWLNLFDSDTRELLHDTGATSTMDAFVRGTVT